MKFTIKDIPADASAQPSEVLYQNRTQGAKNRKMLKSLLHKYNFFVCKQLLNIHFFTYSLRLFFHCSFKILITDIKTNVFSFKQDCCNGSGSGTDKRIRNNVPLI